MSATALPQLQTAVVARGRQNAAVTALVTGIFDAVPQGQKRPYVVYDEATELQNRSLGQGGHLIALTLSVYTQDAAPTSAGRGSAGYAQGLAIANLLAADLTDLDEPLVVDDHDVVDVDVESIDCLRDDEDGTTRRVDLMLMVTLEDEQ
jgi:hypothetical protein